MKEKSSSATIDNPSADNIDICPVSYESGETLSDLAVQVGGLKFREVKKTKLEKVVKK